VGFLVGEVSLDVRRFAISQPKYLAGALPGTAGNFDPSGEFQNISADQMDFFARTVDRFVCLGDVVLLHRAIYAHHDLPIGAADGRAMRKSWFSLPPRRRSGGVLVGASFDGLAGLGNVLAGARRGMAGPKKRGHAQKGEQCDGQ
jgi:hypothetical protein